MNQMNDDVKSSDRVGKRRYVREITRIPFNIVHLIGKMSVAAKGAYAHTGGGKPTAKIGADEAAAAKHNT